MRRSVIRVGRDPENDIVIEASTTSARHSEISWEHGSYWIYDLNSTNGTYVNGSRVRRAPLEAQSWIRFGPSGPEYAIEPDKSSVHETVKLTAVGASGEEEVKPRPPVKPAASIGTEDEKRPASDASAEEEVELRPPVKPPAPITTEGEKQPATDASGEGEAKPRPPVEPAASITTEDEKQPAVDASGEDEVEPRPSVKPATSITPEDQKSLSDAARRAREARGTGKMPSDFFVSYTQADLHWAEWIAWQLEQAGFTTVIQAWDFRPGSNFMLDMQKAAEEADRTIAVLSPDYLESAYAQQEWASALAADPTGKGGKLLPVRVRECEPKGLLTQVVYVDLVGLSDLAASNTLLSGINRDRAKPGAPPQFPSATTQSPHFPGEADDESTDEGATPVPVVHIAISCPSELLGTESQNITIDFEVVSQSAQVSLLVQQEAFLVTGEGSAAGGEFVYSFSAPGRYKKKLRVCAKQAGGANHPLTIAGYAAGRVMLVRGSYVIRIIEPALTSRIVSIVKRHRWAAAAVFVAVCGLSFWLMPTSARLWLLLHANPMKPANYLQGSSSLPGKHDWNDFFASATVTKERAVSTFHPCRSSVMNTTSASG